MATVTKFLETYKKLENEIRALNPNDTIYDYENRLMTMDPSKAEKLKVCRINRNFIQHNADGERFMGSISDRWITFLEQEINAIHAKNDLVKKHIYKAVALNEKSNISDAIDAVVKSKIDVIPVVGKNNCFLGVITPQQILIAYKKAGNLRKKLFDHVTPKHIENTVQNYVFAKPTDRYLDHVTEEKCVVTSDGTVAGTYIGFLKGE